MPAKKINLSSDVKARLRQAVLGGIDSARAKPATSGSISGGKAKPANKSPIPDLIKARPAAKTLKKTIVETPAAKAIKKPLLLEYKPKAVVAKAKPLTSPKKPVPAKRAASRAAKIAPVKPIIPQMEKLIPPFPSAAPQAKPTGYRPFAAAKRDWEKPPAAALLWRGKRKEESLEKLFKKADRKKIARKTDNFFKFSAKAESTPRKNIWLRLIGVVVLFMILLSGYMALGIYGYGFNDVISNSLAKALRLPAGYVNGVSIGAGAYMDNIGLLAQPLAMSREGLIDYSGKTDLSDKIFYRLAANELVAEKLKSYDKTVTADDLDNQIAALLRQTGGQEQAEKIILNLYGMNIAQFKALVLAPMVARANLQTAIIGDESWAITQAARARAHEVLNLALASTTDFNALAKQYTDDESGVNTGGDLGWVVRGQLDPAWEDAIFSAAAGTVISQPIISGFGYHIIKVEQKLTDKATGAESVKLRHILVRVDVDKYIKDLLDAAEIVKYIK